MLAFGPIREARALLIGRLRARRAFEPESKRIQSRYSRPTRIESCIRAAPPLPFPLLSSLWTPRAPLWLPKEHRDSAHSCRRLAAASWNSAISGATEQHSTLRAQYIKRASTSTTQSIFTTSFLPVLTLSFSQNKLRSYFIRVHSGQEMRRDEVR